MLTQVNETKEKKNGILRDAVNIAESVVPVALNVDRLKERASLAIEDGMVDARRMVKRGVYAAEDLVEDTAHRIKKDPFASVGITFGVGMGLGVFVGWLIARKTKACSES